MRFGAHCSTAGGFHTALQRCRTIGADVCQIFVKNNMRWFGRAPLAEELASYSRELRASQCKCVFGHAGYLINLAAPPCDNRDKSVQSLVQELLIATQLGLPFLVLHPGAHLGAGEEIGLQRTVDGLDEVIGATRRSGVRIALENTAGQGTCLGHKLGQLCSIFERVRKPERLGICLDTAHLFAAGYDIRTQQGWDAAIREVTSSVGLKHILAFHLNDSRTDLGSRVDRHAHIGQGLIGLAGFRIVVNDARFKRHPACLETPKSDNLSEDITNLATLRCLVRNTTAAAKRRNPPLGISPH